jgi:hypothetical protein
MWFAATVQLRKDAFFNMPTGAGGRRSSIRQRRSSFCETRLKVKASERSLGGSLAVRQRAG